MSSSITSRYFVLKAGTTALEEFEIPEICEPGQSYPLFAALGNVRNGFGIRPIAEPRHLPDALNIWSDEDAHWQTALCLTLTEMLAYDWLSPVWHQLRPSLGESAPLHQYTRHFREQTLYALQQHQSEGEVYMLFFID